MIELDKRTLAEVILSSAISLEIVGGSKRYRNRSEMQTFPKRIVFDFDESKSYFVVNNKVIVNIETGEKLITNDEIIKELERTLTGPNEKTVDLSNLDNLTEGDIDNSENGFEFIKLDEITRSVLVFSKQYISKFVNSPANILGEMVISYFKLWYMGKVGNGKKFAQAHHEKFKTFSMKEMDYLKHMYMPLAITPNELMPISRAVQVAIERSTLSPFVETDIGYNISASRVEGSKMYWIPRNIAKEYLDETDDFKVTTERLIEKLMMSAGFMGMPAIENQKPIANSVTTKDSITKTTNDFILKSAYKNEGNSVLGNAIKPKAIISYDIEEEDNLIPSDAGELSLDY